MKEIRLGVIGTWGRGRLAVAAHMPKKNVRIVAGADIYEDSLKKFQERIGFKINTYTDYKKMLDREDLDAVFVTSPDFCHEISLENPRIYLLLLLS